MDNIEYVLEDTNNAPIIAINPNRPIGVNNEYLFLFMSGDLLHNHYNI